MLSDPDLRKKPISQNALEFGFRGSGSLLEVVGFSGGLQGMSTDLEVF